MAAAYVNLPCCTFFDADTPPTPLLYCIHPEKHIRYIPSSFQPPEVLLHQSLCTRQKKLKNPNCLAKRWRVFQRRRFWPFSGRSTTFCAASIGHFKPGSKPKNFKQSQEKILMISWEFQAHPAHISTVNILHFCPSRPS